MIKSYAVSAIILFCAVLIETAILSNITILPAVPDLILLCTIFFALLNGKIAGEINGFIAGAFIDFLSGAPFGFNCLYRTLIGYIMGIIGHKFSFVGFFMPAFCAFFATLLKSLFVWIIAFLFPHVSAVYRIASLPFLFELVCNTILAPFVFKFLYLFESPLIQRKDI